MAEYPWIIDGNWAALEPFLVPHEARDWTRERFGETKFMCVKFYSSGNWVKVREGIYLLSWNRKEPEAEDWTPLYIPHPMVVDLTTDVGDQNAFLYRLATKEHEAWRDVPPPSIFHGVELRTEFWDEPAVRMGVPILAAAVVGAGVTKALKWW